MNRHQLTLTGNLDAGARAEVARLIGQERAAEPLVERAGMVVEYRRAGELRCGFLERTPGGKHGYRVIGLDGRPHRMRRDKLVDRARDHIAPHPAGPALRALRALDDRREAARRVVDLETLWRVVTDAQPGRAWSLLDLLDLHDAGEADETRRTGLLRALWEESFFVRDGDGWRPRPVEALEAARAALAQRRARDERLAALSGWLRRVADGEPVEPRPENAEEAVGHLIESATGESGPEAAELMQAAHLHGAGAAFDVLVRIGRFSLYENLEMHRLGVPEEFTRPAQEAAERLAALPPPAWNGRRRWGSRCAVSPGGERAYAVRRRWRGGWQVDIHLAVPALWVDGVLDIEAQRRGATVRLIDRTLPLLPAIVRQHSRLTPDAPRPALTLRLRLSEERAITGVELLRSVVRPRRTLDSGPSLLVDLARDLRGARRAAGAWEALGRPRMLVDAEDRVRPVDESPAEAIDTELRLLASCAIARLCADRRVPAIHRVREAPAEVIDGVEPEGLRAFLAEGRAAHEAQRLEPAPHAGLGLQPRAAGADPLHDAVDLAMQRQLLHLAGHLATSVPAQRFEALLRDTEAAREARRRIEGFDRRYGALAWLASLPNGASVAAHVVEARGMGYLAVLDDVPAAGHAQASRRERVDFRPGQAIRVRIDQVSARQNVLRLADPEPA
jgi:hypothetical protein